jgi:UDP-glucose 4-epimerase
MNFSFDKSSTVLVIGAAGGLAQITIGLLSKHYPHLKIVGVDNRTRMPMADRKNVIIHPMNYTRGNFEKLFRDYSFDAVFHLGRLSHSKLNAKYSLSERLDLNVMGTNRILDLSLKFNVKKVLILSTFHVYGALADNPIFIREDHPLRASIKHPELRDVTEMDQVATSWMWQHQSEIQTLVLRPCNIIGPQINNSITQYLRASYAPVPIDFNPMFQFIHEFDMARVIVQSVENVPTGIYNIAPEDSIPLKLAREIVGRPSLKVPISLLEPAAMIVKKLWRFPDYMIDYVKFSCVISSSSLGKHLPQDLYRFKTKEALELLRLN